MTLRQAPEILQIPLADLDPAGLPPRGTAEFEQAVIGRYSARSLLLMPFPGGMIKQRDGGGGIPLRELEQTNPSGESLVTKPRDRSSVPC